MDLSLEAYRIIVKNVNNRSDMVALCRVSKAFQHAAERALYNTLFMHDVTTTMLLCETLSRQSRISALVDALTISLSDSDASLGSSAEQDEEEELEYYDEDQENPVSIHSSSTTRQHLQTANPGTGLPNDYWKTISLALQRTNRLRYLNIHLIGNYSTSVAWIFNGCLFRLRGFHCDLDWDPDLVRFLNSQDELEDLYIADFKESSSSPVVSPMSTESSSPPPDSPISPDSDISSPEPEQAIQPSPFHISPQGLARLRILECTFTEAAVHLVPSRPVTFLKTCFSRTILEEKRVEMRSLLDIIRLGSNPGSLEGLDLADAIYTEAFSMELLEGLVATISVSRRRPPSLRYLGTMVLPIGGKKRLYFYSLLMKLPRLQCIELDVTHWTPQPISFGALRALGGELRLYCPNVTRVVFVRDFDRSVITYVEGVCTPDHGVSADLLWRDLSD
ncbi:hypothetical protein C8J56DRAFT_1072468 [Mycena floridula]|nr:hypothetical protein C8J56DRAFT_1072468 [Mycena floridula]